MKDQLLKIGQTFQKMLNRVFKHLSFNILPKNKKLKTGLVVFILVGVLVIASPAYAGVEEVLAAMGEAIMSAINHLLLWAAYGLGWLVTKAFAVVVLIAAHNEFVTSPAVTKGWVLMRDTCNLLFVIILLVIAFGQILGIEKYSIKKTLPKVVIAAILVNFSKLICGLMIDFGQVIMMTFVNGFAATAGANLTNGLGLTKLMKMAEDPSADGIEQSDIFLSLFLGVFLLLITLLVVIFILGLLVLRIVTLWLLVVFSPIAFAGGALDFTKKYANQWWEKFGWTVAVGPVLAFCLWLSLLMMSNPQDNFTQIDASAIEEKANYGQTSESGKINNLANFAIALALLIAGLQISQQAGGMVGAAAGKMKGATTKVAKGMAMRMTGAQFVSDRGKAIAGGYMAARAKRKEQVLGKYKGVGEKAGVGVTRGVGALKKAPGAIIRGGAYGSAGAVKGLFKGGAKGWKAGKGLPGKIGKALAGAGAGATEGFGRMGWEGMKEEWHKGGFGRGDWEFSMEEEPKKAKDVQAYEKQKERLESRLNRIGGATEQEQKDKQNNELRQIMQNKSEDENLRRAAAVRLSSDKKAMTADDYATVEDVMGKKANPPESIKDEFMKNIRKDKAHVLAGTPEGLQQLEEDASKKKFKLEDQSEELFENEEGLHAVMKGKGYKDFAKEMDKLPKAKRDVAEDTMEKWAGSSDIEKQKALAQATGKVDHLASSPKDMKEAMKEISTKQQAKILKNSDNKGLMPEVAAHIESDDLRALAKYASGEKGDKKTREGLGELINGSLNNIHQGEVSGATSEQKDRAIGARHQITDLAADSKSLGGLGKELKGKIEKEALKPPHFEREASGWMKSGGKAYKKEKTGKWRERRISEPKSPGTYVNTVKASDLEKKLVDHIDGIEEKIDYHVGSRDATSDPTETAYHDEKITNLENELKAVKS